uniref:Uncharacterized protein n=1 Tax=Wuchereria bancrofti TaxID=6293 RepID=A0A1I8EN75_WUCBA
MILNEFLSNQSIFSSTKISNDQQYPYSFGLQLFYLCGKIFDHWRKIIVPMATAKHCEASGNLLNVKNEIMTMPAWDGILEARFEQTTQSVQDEIKWFPEEDTAEMQSQEEKKKNTE